jgi:hypothetical protein
MREALHTAVDRIIDEYLAAGGSSTQPSAGQPVPTIEVPLIIRGDDVGQWSYRWPSDEGTENFYASSQYDLVTPHRTHRVRVAWSERQAWGRTDRKRAIVFGQAGASSTNFWPWTEFVETDTGRYAAPIPNPDHPRKVLTPSDPLPSRFRNAQVERTDQLFDHIVNGPSLRLAVDAEDEEDMIRHGYWVARLRNRL